MAPDADPSTAKVVWRPYAHAGTAVTSLDSPGDGTWVFVAVTFASGSHTLYLDGVAQGTSGLTGSFTNYSSTPLTLGGWTGDGTC